jgi:iron complex outermembrane receptor protein
MTCKFDTRASLATLLALGMTISPLSAAVAEALAAAPASTSDPGELEEIIVTATKHAQDLQKTAAAITALDGTSLVYAGVTDIRAAQQFIPSVRFQAQTSSTEIYIRGVGSTLDLPQIDPPTALNFNSVFIPREATSVPLYDVEQIEVLPGPQGTLYGRSVMGGTVNVTYRRPTGDFESLGTLEVGDDSLFHLSAAQNLPVSDSIAIRVAADYLSHAGYMESGADSQKDWGARVSVLWQPSDDFSAYLWYAAADKKGHPANLVVKGVNPNTGELDPDRYLQSDPWNDQLPGIWGTIAETNLFGQPQAQNQHYDNHMVSGQFDYRLTDAITLTYIPSYLDVYTSADYWLGAFPGDQTNAYRQQTHELRATGQHGWGKWLAGLYYYDLHSNGIFSFGGFDLSTALFPVSIVDENHLRGTAAFGEATYDFTDRLRFTIGGRYQEDDRTANGRFFNGVGLAPYDYDEGFSNFDYKVGVEFDLGDRAMVYAGTQTGYQPGTFNGFASSPALSNEVESADITAYTVGIKTRLFDDRVQINDEVFFYTYDNLIASAYNTVTNSNLSFNVDKAEIYGNQLDLIWLPTDNGRLNLSVGYLHARTTDFQVPPNTVTWDGRTSFDGYQMQYAPDWTVSAGYQHDFHFGTGRLRAALGTRYESSFYADFSHTPGGHQDSYTKSDASVTWFTGDDRWSIGAWIRNIENVAVIAATAGGSNFPPLPEGATAFLEAPRTFGLRATLAIR